MEKLVVLAAFCSLGAYAKRLAPEAKAAADRLGFAPGALQQAWKSATVPAVPMTTISRFGNAALPLSPGGEGGLRPNWLGPSMSVQDEEALSPSDIEVHLPPESVKMNGVDVSGSSLRSTVLTDTSGRQVPVSSLIGDKGKAVVVFLRHLG